MPAIGQILKNAKQALSNQNIESYALDADLLMCKATGLTREKIICYPERIISDKQLDLFEELLKRRINREPMSHILGVREFFGREFIVTADTLDPRPDSECLIEAILEIYKDRPKPENIIDFGTGTGCLLLTVLSEFEDSKGIAVDKSKQAIEVARQNSIKLSLANRVEFVVSNWGKEVKGKYDLIISNPPYIRKNDITVLEPEVANFEPHSALDGGDNGLACYIELAPYIASLIARNGYAVIEHGLNQSNDVRSIMEDSGLEFVAAKKDLAGIDRCIILKSRI